MAITCELLPCPVPWSGPCPRDCHDVTDRQPDGPPNPGQNLALLIRRDVSTLRPGDGIALDLRLPTSRCLDVVHDRTRQTNRLRAPLLELSPALEQTLDLTKNDPAVLLTAYRTPAAIHRTGVRRPETWLRNRNSPIPKSSRARVQGATCLVARV
ncbi:IS110 family transposase [Streptomyces sp. G1]|uniref:IS110 family transposase n=1 Tax=Streptomyces sp. G1 TaxID=361572 RepID=UPI00202F437E|nr:IS110 family transposase [Streptomyces sp. G1]MCM1976486.1 IS110 family transposase [Streptomyces sp. G1]